MGLFQKNAEVEVRALCDVYPVRFKEARAVAPGAKWGDNWLTAWFRGDVTLPAACADRRASRARKPRLVSTS